MAPKIVKSTGGKVKRSKKDPEPEQETAADTDIERTEDEEPDVQEAAINDKIVQFFQIGDRSNFYYISHERWANKKVRDTELKLFAKMLGWTHK